MLKKNSTINYEDLEASVPGIILYQCMRTTGVNECCFGLCAEQFKTGPQELISALLSGQCESHMVTLQVSPGNEVAPLNLHLLFHSL